MQRQLRAKAEEEVEVLKLKVAQAEKINKIKLLYSNKKPPAVPQ